MKDKLGKPIMKECVGLKSKTCSYLKDSSDEHKKAKGTKNCIIKRKLKLQGDKNCLEVAQIKNKIYHL